MAVKVATAAFCCQGLNHCTRARLWARRAPRYCGDLRLAGVLAGHGSTWDVQVRCILMHANENTSGALLRRLAHCSLHARQHAEFAVAAAVQPVLETAECRLAVGMLVIRALAGSRFRPEVIEPSDVASAFVAVSSDCLAVHCAGGSTVGADRLESGVLAFADMLFTGRPELTPTELFRFVASARGTAIGVEGAEAGRGRRTAVAGASRVGCRRRSPRRRRDQPVAERPGERLGGQGDAELPGMDEHVRAAGIGRQTGPVLDPGGRQAGDTCAEARRTAWSRGILCG